MPVDRAVPVQYRIDIGGDRVQGVPSVDIHGGRRRIRHNDRPTVHSPRTEHVGSDNRYLDHVFVRPVQVVLRGCVHRQISHVTRTIRQRTSPGRNRLRPVRKSFHGQSRKAHRSDQHRIRTNWYLTCRVFIPGRDILGTKRVQLSFYFFYFSPTTAGDLYEHYCLLLLLLLPPNPHCSHRLFKRK